MAKCIWCGRKGLFLSVNRDELCERCAFIILNEAKNRIRIINDCGKIIEESHNIKTIISRRDLAFEHLRLLMPYEEKGIPILDRKIIDLIRGFAETVNEKLVFYMHDKFQETGLSLNKSKSEKVNHKLYEKFMHEANEKIENLSEEGSNYIESISVINKLMDDLNELFNYHSPGVK